MKKYQICEKMPATINHAVSKAPDDITQIASKLGFKEIDIYKTSNEYDLKSKLKRQYTYFKNWQSAYKNIDKNSILLLQHPFRTHQVGREKYLKKLKKNKSVKIISLIHDVEELRQSIFNDYYREEFDFMMDVADIIIVHNETMKKFFMQKGFDRSNLITLNIFDYLRSDYREKLPKYSKKVTIAGNLDVKKAQYLKDLDKVKANFTLYGPNYTLHDFKNCKYCGVFPTTEIPDKLNEGWGLIWDGISIDTCEGPTGNYLRYNNPHKLSLYLSSNLPVIIWDQAAEATFVNENKVGITVSSLQDLNKKLTTISEGEYNIYAENVANIAKRLVKGYYSKSALKEDLLKIN